MKKGTMKIYKKGVMLILSMMTFGLLLQNCDNQSVVDDELSRDLTLKKYSIMLPEGVVPPAPCKQVCLVAGQYTYTGTVDVASMDGDVYVTYNITEPDIYLMEIHLDIFDSEDDFKAQKKISNGGAIPGKFTFKKTWDEEDKKTSFTVMIPAAYVDDLESEDDCYFIASHAALSNGETAWGGLCDEIDGVSFNNDVLQFPGKNWSVYFQYCMEECDNTVNFTYAWEDLMKDGVDGNDGDYNDLVVQSGIIKTDDQLMISFYASARGADYDHAFKIRVPKLGIIGGMSGITGDDGVVEDGTDYIITVFSSTKAELPGEGIAPYGFAANTVMTDTDCDPVGTADITISINSDFVYNPAEPYDPFITVHPGTLIAYDLNIWELHPLDGDTWLDAGGVEYPNGILIPYNWEWPYEKINITEAYNGFSGVTTWNASWSETLSDPSKVFDVDCD
jgi:hypothetical protein